MTYHSFTVPTTGPRLANLGRVKTEVSRMGLAEGREFRTFFEFSIGTGAQATVKFVSAVPFVLIEQTLSLDDGTIRLAPTTGATPTGDYSVSLPVIGVNRHLNRPAPYYESAVVLTTGGGITGGTEVEVVRLACGTGGNSSSANGGIFQPRMLPAGTYYLKLTSLDAGTSTGVYSITWEERPDLE